MVKSGEQWVHCVFPFSFGVALMIFYGNYKYSLDDKKRVAVPAKFREIAGDEGRGFYITTTKGDYLQMYPKSVWEQVTAELGAKAFPDPQTLEVITLLFGQAEFVECDKQGRISLRNASDVGIDREAVFVGVSNQIQIWNPKRYEVHMADLKSRSDQLLNSIGK